MERILPNRSPHSGIMIKCRLCHQNTFVKGEGCKNEQCKASASKISCYNCKGDHHFNDCDQERKCTTCGEDGHIYVECKLCSICKEEHPKGRCKLCKHCKKPGLIVRNNKRFCPHHCYYCDFKGKEGWKKHSLAECKDAECRGCKARGVTLHWCEECAKKEKMMPKPVRILQRPEKRNIAGAMLVPSMDGILQIYANTPIGGLFLPVELCSTAGGANHPYLLRVNGQLMRVRFEPIQ